MLIVESDNSLCVKWLGNRHAAPCPFKDLVEDCYIMSSGFKWSIEHVERLANALQFLKWKGCDLTMHCGFARSTLLCEKVVDG
ncbi:hypothetical protein GQ457_03G037010 [Hibiscus cannabinus]